MAKKINIIANLIDTQLKKQLADIEKGKYKVNIDVDGEKINNTNKNMKQLGNTTASTNGIFGKLKETITNTFSASRISMTGFLAVLTEIHKAGQNAKETIKELDKAVTDLSVATNMSRESVSSLLQTYNDYAKELKSTTLDVSQAADDYLRAGKSMSESQELIKDSVMLSKLGQIDSSAATEDLLATMNGFDMSVDEVGKALDAMVAVDLEASTSAGDIATALKYCASSADMAGVSFSKLTGMIAETQDKTMQSAETIGVFYNTLLSRYRDIKIGNYLSEDGEDISDYESVLKSVGVNLRDAQGDFRNFEVVLDELAGKWSSLTSVQQAAVIKVAAGTRQQNRFIALMEGYDKVLELTETAANSAGTALDKFNTSYANSLEAKQNTLQASFESMIMNSDFDEVYGGILEATTALVNFINETNALKGAMSGLTIGAGIKAFIAIKGGINEAYIELNKFQNALKIVKKTEISTESFERLKLLCDGLSKSQMKLVLSTNQLSVEQKKELLMASSLSEEEATLQLQTWNMAKANNGLTTSTTSASNAFKGLWATIKANKFMLITSAIMIGVSAINKYKETLENARSAAEDAKSTLSDMNKSVTDNGSWLAENTDRYKELSEGVNSLGQNVSLTDEEFKEYNTLTNEIAEMFPTLVTGYTDTGTAILSCKNNVDLLTKAYEEQKQAAQDAVIRNADDLVSGFNADTTNTNLFENNGMSKVDQLDLLNKMLNGNISNVPMDLSNTILKNAGVKVSWLESLTYDKGELDKKIQENKEQLYAYKRTLESEMEAATSDITPLIDYFLDTNKNFNELDESTKAGIKQVADNMGYEFYNSLASGEELTKTDLANWVDNTLLPSISNNGNANKAFSKLFTLNADDMPVSEYVTTVNDLVSKICMAVGGDPDKIKINLGFDVQADEDLLDKVYKVAGVDGSKFYNPGSDEANQQKELKSWIDSLNKDDLKLIAQGEVEFDEHTTVESAKEALKEAQSYADENPIEANATLSSVDALAAVESLSEGLDQLDSIYADILDGKDFDWGSILNNQDFQDIFGSMGETYENFINTVTNNPADISACQAAFDDLSNAYIYQSGVLDELNESNAQAAINMLDSMGVANAEAVVMNYLAAQTEYAAIAKDNAAYSSAVLAEATLQDINNILAEGSVTEDTKNKIVTYYLEKLTASGITLDTAEDCNQLMNLISSLGGATSALGVYYSALQGNMNVTAVNGDNSHGGLSGKDTPYQKQMAQVQAQKEAETQLNKILENTKSSMNKVSFKGGTKSNGVRKSQSKGSGSGSGSKSKDNDAEKAQKEAEEAAKKAEEERKKAIEEEEKRLTDALSRIQNAIDELDKEASNKFHNWDERNSALQAEMDTIPQAIAAQQQLVDFYNTTGNDPTKAQEAANAIKDLRRQLEELANQKLENIKQFNEDIISLIDSLKELSQSIIDIKEARGFAYNAGDYQELISKSEEERRQYEKELSELQAQLQYNIDRGYLQEGSETWYEWQKELNGIKKSMNECIKAQVEWNKEIQKIPFTALENFGKLIDKATTRLDNFASQLEERGLALSVADINEQLMAANEKLLIAQGNANEYYNVIRRNFSDEVNGWGKLTEEQLKQVFHYIDTDDSLRLHNYLADLGFDNYTLQEFYEYVEKLGEANNEIIELKTNIIKLNNAVGELNISGAEKYGILIEKLNNEISSYNNMLNARGLTASIEEIKNEMHGLASTAMIEQNKINNYYYAIRQGLSDSVNGWASLTKEEIDQVIKFIEMNDHQGIFD
ncbi:MAG: phage tail tape measure protein [Agathobacter sp.]|nr:phage tail tape measure protein [Agathobacter sp.]